MLCQMYCRGELLVTGFSDLIIKFNLSEVSLNYKKKHSNQKAEKLKEAEHFYAMPEKKKYMRVN